MEGAMRDSGLTRYSAPIMTGGSMDRYHPPPMPQSGSRLGRFVEDAMTDVGNAMFSEARAGAVAGARAGLKKRKPWRLPSLKTIADEAQAGAVRGGICGAKRGIKRNTLRALETGHAKARRQIQDIFG